MTRAESGGGGGSTFDAWRRAAEKVADAAGEMAREVTKGADKIVQGAGVPRAGEAAADVKQALETTTLEKLGTNDLPLVGQREGESRAEYIARMKDGGLVAGTVAGGAAGAVGGYLTGFATTASAAFPFVKHPAAAAAVGHFGGLISAGIGAYNGAVDGGPKLRQLAEQFAEKNGTDKPDAGKGKPPAPAPAPTNDGAYAPGEVAQTKPGLVPEKGEAATAKPGSSPERGKADAYAPGEVARTKPGLLPESPAPLGDLDEKPRSR